MSLTDDELVAAARREAVARGLSGEVVVEIVERSPQVRVLVSDPAYARGGGLLVVLDAASGAVLRVVPQL